MYFSFIAVYVDSSDSLSPCLNSLFCIFIFHLFFTFIVWEGMEKVCTPAHEEKSEDSLWEWILLSFHCVHSFLRSNSHHQA